jgi:Protein of unknown function (DUF3237)
LLDLVHEFDYHIDLEPTPAACGVGPYGTRFVFSATGGTFEGERFRGTIAPGTVDWALIGLDNVVRLDVRATFLTNDGAALYLQYYGLCKVTPVIGEILAGGGQSTAFEDQYFRANQRFETGDERYSWMNQTLFIGEGRLLANPLGADYRVYRVT